MSIGITANVNAYATPERTMTMMITRRHNEKLSDAGGTSAPHRSET